MSISFDKVCRSCTKEATRMHPLFKAAVGDRIANILNAFTTIAAHESDGLPKQICSRCMDKLKQVVAFKHQTERSDRQLKLQLRHACEVKNESTVEPLHIKVEWDPTSIAYAAEDRGHTQASDYDEKPNDMDDHFGAGGGGGGNDSDSSYVAPKTEGVAKKETDINLVPPKKKSTYVVSDESSSDASGQPKPRRKRKKRTIRPKKDAIKVLPKLYGCAHCKRVCKRRHRFMEHLTVHGFAVKFPCSRCDQEFEKDAMKDHVRLQHSVTAEENLCPVCGKTFAKRGTLRAHLRRHNALKPFQCTECPQGFATKIELQTHTYKHTGERPFKCDVCGHGSTTRGARARHKRIHTGEKKHACDLCPMRFAVAFALRNHRRTHTGEKPYACDQCDRRFTQRTEMVWHRKSHIEGYQFACTLCPMTFGTHSALKDHRKTHAVASRVRQPKDGIGDLFVPEQFVSAMHSGGGGGVGQVETQHSIRFPDQ